MTFVLGVDVMIMSAIPFFTPEAFDLVPDLPFSHQLRIDLLAPGVSELATGVAVRDAPGLDTL